MESTSSEKYRSGVVNLPYDLGKKTGKTILGGAGSGNWYRFDKKTTTDECHSVGVRYLHRKGLLTPGHRFLLRWSRAGRETGSIRCAVIGNEKPEQVILTYRHRSGPSGEWEEVREPVALTWTACNFGGERPWFVCPGAAHPSGPPPRRGALLQRHGRPLERRRAHHRAQGLLIIAGLLFFATPALAQSKQTVTVVRVVDGDTIEVNPAVSGTEGVRPLGVDTPESVDPEEPVEPYGPEASAFTEQQLEGQRVTVIFDQETTDQYGRALAYVRIGGQSETFNETLLRQGYAQLYIVPPNNRYEARFSQAQDKARQAQRGIWSLPKVQQCELADKGNGIGEGSPECEEQVPTPTPVTTPTPTSTPGADRDCPDFETQAEAQAVLRRDPEDPYGLDGPVGRGSTGAG